MVPGFDEERILFRERGQERAAGGGAVAIAAAAEVLRVDSAWSAVAPAIDGRLPEWSSPLVTLGSTPVSLGVRNDGEFLYVALASSEQATRTMLGAAGFTVWFDPKGKDKKSFGITVPPTMTGGPGMRGRGPGGAPQSASASSPPSCNRLAGAEKRAGAAAWPEGLRAAVEAERAGWAAGWAAAEWAGAASAAA